MKSSDLWSLLPSVADVGGAVFTRPPWNEPLAVARTVASRLLADSSRPGFTLAAAFAGEELIGFGYGHRCSSLAALLHQPTGADFILRELCVTPGHRGWGVGGALHDAVINSPAPGPRWLITNARAKAAIGLYRQRGWQTVALHPDGAQRLIMRMGPR
ncbi:GNAT family N-acetyltransferase [Herbidospora cretacea]|uniref:GNAT family N-acetyltransferase n=1 Tax=Herbidospora cretacea TaxID=28444 RepID=UPI000774B80F|nr:GNAT family N-acetyltransferase [Herbidospora cretacea]